MLRSGSHQDGGGTNKNACEGVAGALIWLGNGMCTNDYTTDFVKPVSFAFCVSGNALGRGEGF